MYADVWGIKTGGITITAEHIIKTGGIYTLVPTEVGIRSSGIGVPGKSSSRAMPSEIGYDPIHQINWCRAGH